MIDNYNDFINFIHNLDYKPKLLLHACCAPCSTHCLLVLRKYFDITVFYSNDNIYPYEEYEKRLNEMKRFLKDFDINVKEIDDGYNHDDFLDVVKGIEHLGERTKRCYNCYMLRMKKTVEIGKKLGFEYFTTTLSLSPYKNSDWINEIGYNLEKEYGIKYLYSNFKKENGYKDSIKMSEEYCLYRQNYCGCEFSKKEREDHERIKKEN
ncbi:MAG: epoxyqueuosine reductase QueH [Acholeplasmatales bacterium]|nr:epoxyqueuosine reductase QueH [Acholeplasmatales bacterium]